ncbi:MAG: hypothetical protein RIB32_03665 [Phycisphaerales bacterium]
MIPTRFLTAAAVALLPTLALAQPTGVGVAGSPSIEPIPLCTLVPNGSFTDGFAHWRIDFCNDGFGDFLADGSASILDLSSTPGCDANVACASIFARAAWTCDKPSGSAGTSQVTFGASAIVTGRYLRFKTTGGFEFILWANGQVNYDVLVKVTNEDGATVTCPILDGQFGCGDFDLACDVGIQALGIIPHETFCCDVTGSSDIAIGDRVRIEFVFSTSTVAADECDIAEFFGTACIDRVRFCNACLIPYPATPLPLEIEALSHRAPAAMLDEAHSTSLAQLGAATPARPDFTGDGRVDARDVERLADLIARGETDAAQLDVDRNGVVDESDVAALVDQLDAIKGRSSPSASAPR